MNVIFNRKTLCRKKQSADISIECTQNVLWCDKNTVNTVILSVRHIKHYIGTLRPYNTVLQKPIVAQLVKIPRLV